MDFIFPFKHFNNTIIRNTTYLMDLFTKLYLTKINFKVIVENNEFFLLYLQKNNWGWHAYFIKVQNLC